MRTTITTFLLLIASAASAAHAAEGESTFTATGLKPISEKRPQLGFQLGMAPDVRPNADVAGATPTSFRTLGAGVEFQPAFIQSIGVVGVGAGARMHPEQKVGSAFGPMNAWSWGFQGRYQAVFLKGQWLVPTASYAVEQWRLRSKEKFIGHGPSAGLMLLLNALDANASNVIHQNWGISRTYLSFDYQWFKYEKVAAYDALSVGLRFEML